MTAPTSSYPRTVADLLPGALALADQLGELPSRNRLMREFRIGAPKADELRTRLAVDMRRDQLDLDWPDGPADPATDPWLHAEPAEPDPGTAVGSGVDDMPDTRVPDAVPAGPGPSAAEPDADSRPVAGGPVDVVPDTQVYDDGHPSTDADPAGPVADEKPQVGVDGHPGTDPQPGRTRRAAVWPIVLLALPAFVAVWSGWVGLGRMTGFGMVDLLPGIVDPGSWATIDSAITLPIGVETYGAYALYVWLSGRVPDPARRFARWSAIASLAVGALGQVAYHLLAAGGVTSAPWQITTAVACLPVAVLGMGAALAHLVRGD